MLYKSEYPSIIGVLTIVCDENHILALLMEKERYNEEIAEKAVFNPKFPLLEAAAKWLDRYFNGEKPAILELPLKPEGSDFRKNVWKILMEIPYGSVVTYGDIAGRIAKEMGKHKMSAQAVGGAVGHNPISIIVPCHRVVGRNGNLTGFGGGMEAKIKLLEHEGHDMSKFHMPKVAAR